MRRSAPGPRARSLGLIGLALAMSLSGCTDPNDPPDALKDYLDALVSGEYETAWKLTQFAKGGFPTGAAVSAEHFEAFYEANPVKGWKVTRLRKADLRELGASEGIPFYEVDVDLEYGDATRKEVYSVEGKVLPVITVEPVPINVKPVDPVDEIFVDDVQVDVRANEEFLLLVLNGPHELRIGNTTLRVGASPLTVLEGDASVDDSTGNQLLVVG
jgi:hypothetical protein